MILLILIILFAAAGGFLGDLLELAGWILLFFVALGAVIGAAAYLGIRRLRARFR